MDNTDNLIRITTQQISFKPIKGRCLSRSFLRFGNRREDFIKRRFPKHSIFKAWEVLK